MSSFKIMSIAETEKLWNSSGVDSGRGKYPWRRLNVGQSFFIPRNQYSREDYRPSAPPSVLADGYKFATKKVQDGKTIGLQIKRIV